MQQIPPTEVVFDPDSGKDPHGKVFRWQGRLYRGISAASAPMFIRLFQNGTIRQLVDAGLLVETELTEYSLDGYELVVQHRAIPFVSYPTEWCPAMLRDAALLTLALVKELAGSGLTLKDSHPWNLLFDGYKPLHIDLTSIIPLREDSAWTGYDSFCRNFFRPLLLMTHGKEQAARAFIDSDRGVWRRDLLRLAPTTAPWVLFDFARSRCSAARTRWRPYQRQGNLKSLFALLRRMTSIVASLSLPGGRVRTASRSDRNCESPVAWGSLTHEQETVNKLIAEMRPNSVLHVGSHEDFYPKLVSMAGCDVVSFDAEVSSNTRLYLIARAQRLPVLPVMIDFPKAIRCNDGISQQTVPTNQRFQSDMVLAPSILRFLESEPGLSFEQIIAGLALFSRRWVVVGFVPRRNHIAGFAKGSPWVWDSLSKFSGFLRQRFRAVNVVPLESSTRALCVCEK